MVIVRDINSPLSTIDRKKKENQLGYKETQQYHQQDLINVYKTLYPTTEYTFVLFFSNTHGTYKPYPEP